MLKPFQRDMPGDPAELSARLEAVNRELPQLNGPERLAHLGEAGTLARGLRDYATAETYFRAAIALATVLKDERQLAANTVRLGVVLHHDGSGREAEAEACFADILSRADAGAAAYHDFALQHLGKLQVEQGRLSEARGCFRRALALRELKGDPELIASTQRALAGLAEFPDLGPLPGSLPDSA